MAIESSGSAYKIRVAEILQSARGADILRMSQSLARPSFLSPPGVRRPRPWPKRGATPERWRWPSSISRVKHVYFEKMDDTQNGSVKVAVARRGRRRIQAADEGVGHSTATPDGLKFSSALTGACRSACRS